jgi:hypothetical protein
MIRFQQVVKVFILKGGRVVVVLLLKKKPDLTDYSVFEIDGSHACNAFKLFVERRFT